VRPVEGDPLPTESAPLLTAILSLVPERGRLEMELREVRRLREDFDPSSNEARHYNRWAAELEAKLAALKPSS
jgi:hypothetical protein